MLTMLMKQWFFLKPRLLNTLILSTQHIKVTF